MKALPILASIVGLISAFPQRGSNCQCRDVICPNNGREACTCLNAAADLCYRGWGNANCPSPVPLNCDSPNSRPPQGPYGGNQSPTWRPGITSYSTVYSVVPYRTTITTTLGGFGWPNPVTSYSYGMSTTTITVVHTPGQPSSPKGGPKTTTITQNPKTPTQQTPKSPTPTPKTSAPPPPPPPPPSSTANSAPPTTASTTKPTPWRPPVSTGPSWTPIAQPTLPSSAPPVIPSPPPPPPPPPPPSSTAAPTSAPTTRPEPVIPGQPVRCGPGQPACTGNTYCDPQPLCSIGEDCPGVCLPIINLRFASSYFMQPWERRREYWQKMLDEGYYVMYRYSL